MKIDGQCPSRDSLRHKSRPPWFGSAGVEPCPKQQSRKQCLYLMTARDNPFGFQLPPGTRRPFCFQAIAAGTEIILFLSIPNFSISHSTTSPGCKYSARDNPFGFQLPPGTRRPFCFQAIAAGTEITLFLSIPNFSISHSTTSPGCKYSARDNPFGFQLPPGTRRPFCFQAIAAGTEITLFLSIPNFSISHSTTSPGCKYSGGFLV